MFPRSLCLLRDCIWIFLDIDNIPSASHGGQVSQFSNKIKQGGIKGGIIMHEGGIKTGIGREIQNQGTGVKSPDSEIPQTDQYSPVPSSA